MNKTSLVILIIVLLTAFGALAWYRESHPHAPLTPPGVASAAPSGATVVTLTDDGFQPSEITIHAGQTVTFRTTSGKPFWPASDPHPSHTNYPEFDPKDPIAPDAVWSFAFTKIGTWGYHDHLAPYFTGTIHVEQ